MFSRKIIPKVMEALSDTPVILLSGARQTGKSTLMQALALPKAVKSQVSTRYVTLDEPEVYSAALSNPHGFIAALGNRTLIDEVQRVPELFLAIKHAVDQDRRPGRFLLTGSANVMLLPRISESLAGRMEILTLRPLAQLEMAEPQFASKSPNDPGSEAQTNVIDAWFSISQTNLNVDREASSRTVLLQRLWAGGYPEAVARTSSKRRIAWFDNYLNTVLLRDIRDITQIDGLTQLPKLLQAVAHRTGGPLNVADLSRTLGMPQTSVRRYLTLLETVYLIESLPAWTHRTSHKAQKMPKVYINDSGVFAHVLGLSQSNAQVGTVDASLNINGALVETFVHSELRKHLSWADTSAQLMHYRTSTGLEVDFILEDRLGRIIGIEVKSSATVGSSDFKGLRHLQSLLGDKFIRGIVLHPGERSLQWDPQMVSMPMSCLW
jgi:uncharacterized protein